jgi:hypothetical protein
MTDQKKTMSDRIDPHYATVLRQIAKMIGWKRLVEVVRDLEAQDHPHNPQPSNLETIVAAAARTGDPSDPDTLRAAARDARLATAKEKARALKEDTKSLVVFATDDARVEDRSRALHEAHLAVADAAGEWYDVEVDGDADQKRDTRDDLRAAVERWRAAGERFVHAVRGGA